MYWTKTSQNQSQKLIFVQNTNRFNYSWMLFSKHKIRNINKSASTHKTQVIIIIIIKIMLNNDTYIHTRCLTIVSYSLYYIIYIFFLIKYKCFVIDIAVLMSWWWDEENRRKKIFKAFSMYSTLCTHTPYICFMS